MQEVLDLKELGLERGGHILIKRALAGIAVGESLEVSGRDPMLSMHLEVWARAQGHGFRAPTTLVRGGAQVGRWRDAQRSGGTDPKVDGSIVDNPDAVWGLAARGAQVEAGGPEFHFPLSDKNVVWADEAAKLYAQAAAAQWDPESAIDWQAKISHSEEVEDAVVQVMTYLIENETAALIVPANFLAKLHPHFKEVMQVLAIQAADEARHIEVFTRRALLKRKELGLSTVGGQASLKTLIDEPDFALAAFMLSVLGEGSFLSLLWFLNTHAPDPVTAQVAKLAAQDEARHVAFGLAHLRRHLSLDPHLKARLTMAVEQRHQSLSHTSGLNEEVFDALVVLAAGAFTHEAIAQGHRKVALLKKEMDEGRQSRLLKLGFATEEAASLSQLHTRNFM